MDNGGEPTRKIWDEWAHRPAELAKVVASIRAVGLSDEAEEPTDEDEEYGAEEGRILYRKHRARERDRSLVRRKKQQVLKRTGRLVCEVCDFNAAEVYGADVGDVVDVHHVVPLHMVGEGTTRLSDLAIVCPTCHRVIHAHKPFIRPAQLRAKREASAKSIGPHGGRLRQLSEGDADGSRGS